MALETMMMAPGTVLDVKKYRGEEENYVGKVVEVIDTHARPVKRGSRRSRVITRSQYRFTLEGVNVPEGGQKFKSFYHEFVEAERVG
jgi:hypothetical protein